MKRAPIAEPTTTCAAATSSHGGAASLMPVTWTKALASIGPESRYAGSRMSRPATTPAIAHAASTATSVASTAPIEGPIADGVVVTPVM